MNNAPSPGDTSIQANLYRNAIMKKASHRNWQEWDALYDFEVRGNEVLSKKVHRLEKNSKYDVISALLFGTAVGLIIAVTLITLFP